MKDMDDFRHQLEGLVRQAEDEARTRKARQEFAQRLHEDSLLHFDQHADSIQLNIVAPRMRYVASLFDHAHGLEMAEGHEYRHRIHLHFGHTAKYPCTADLTFLLLHGATKGFLEVRFEFLILPAYVTDRYKISDSIPVPTDESGYPAVARFVETRIETFLASYLKARRI